MASRKQIKCLETGCDFVEFKSGGLMYHHSNSHNGTAMDAYRPGRCNWCYMDTNTAGEFRHHLRIAHNRVENEKHLQCHICDRKFNEKNKCQMHIFEHYFMYKYKFGYRYDMQEIKCLHCQFVADSVGMLKAHIMKHHETLLKKHCICCSYWNL